MSIKSALMSIKSALITTNPAPSLAWRKLERLQFSRSSHMRMAASVSASPARVTFVSTSNGALGWQKCNPTKDQGGRLLVLLRTTLPASAPLLVARRLFPRLTSKLNPVAELATVQRAIRFCEVDGAVVTQDALAVAVQRRRTGAPFVKGCGTARFVIKRFHDRLTFSAASLIPLVSNVVHTFATGHTGRPVCVDYRCHPKGSTARISKTTNFKVVPTARA